MSWQGIEGHDDIVEQFRRSLRQRRLATTFLFVGPEGVGKRTFAVKLAQAMLCERVAEAELAPCGSCAACQQVMSDTHPDLQLVSKPTERAYIPVSTFIGERDQRSRAGLCHFMSLTPSGGKRRIAIVDDADWLNQEGANSLLKTLEEPSPGAIIILISTSLQRQLPTIRSRSQVIRFRPLSEHDLEQCLANLGFEPSQVPTMTARGEGSVAQAIQRSEESDIEFRRDLWQVLSEDIDRQRFAKVVNEYVEGGSKDTAEKRERLRRALQAAIDFYRLSARQLCDPTATPPGLHQEHVTAFTQHKHADPELVASLVERCVDAIRQTNANGQLNLIVDALASDLALAMTSGHPLLSSVTE